MGPKKDRTLWRVDGTVPVAKGPILQHATVQISIYLSIIPILFNVSIYHSSFSHDTGQYYLLSSLTYLHGI